MLHCLRSIDESRQRWFIHVYKCVCVCCVTECSRLSVRLHAGTLYSLNVKRTHIQQQLMSQHLTHIYPTHILFQRSQSGVGKPVARTMARCVTVNFHHHIKRWHTGLVWGWEVWDFKYYNSTRMTSSSSRGLEVVSVLPSRALTSDLGQYVMYDPVQGLSGKWMDVTFLNLFFFSITVSLILLYYF